MTSSQVNKTWNSFVLLQSEVTNHIYVCQFTFHKIIVSIESRKLSVIPSWRSRRRSLFHVLPLPSQFNFWTCWTLSDILSVLSSFQLGLLPFKVVLVRVPLYICLGGSITSSNSNPFYLVHCPFSITLTIVQSKFNGINYLAWSVSVELWFLGLGVCNHLAKMVDELLED